MAETVIDRATTATGTARAEAEAVECICCDPASPARARVAPAFAPAARRVVASLREEFRDALLGVLITGSTITGSHHVNSDIDLFAIIASPRRQRRLFRVPVADSPPATTAPANISNSRSTIQCEVFINPVSRMRNEILALDDAAVHAWRMGHVLYERTPPPSRDLSAVTTANSVSFLRKTAIDTFAKGKQGCRTWDKFRIDSTRYMLMDALLDAWDAIEAGDAASGSIMLSHGLSMALDVLYETRGWWGVKPKKRLLDLKENKLLLDLNRDTRNDARRALQLSRRIARDDLELVERHRALKELVAVVVEPLGGEMVEWVTEWEEVADE